MKKYLDHDTLIDKYGSIHQIIGNYHPPGIVYALKKYVITGENSLWKRRGYGYKRLIKTYTPQSSRIAEKIVYDPLQKSLFPSISSNNIKRHLKPTEGIKRLLSTTQDSLEKTALQLIHQLMDYGVKIELLGLTGSLLIGIHNPTISDIDLVIYDCRIINLIEETKLIKPFRGKKLNEWIQHNSKRLGLPPRILVKMYDPRKRGVFKNTTISIIPVNPKPLSKNDVIINGEYIGHVEILAEAEPKCCKHHYYPHNLDARIIRIIKSHSKIDIDKLKIISYEGMYMNNIIDNRLIKISGKGYYNDTHLIIIIGTRESKSYIIPLD